MLKDYVLGAELAKKGDFHIANISMVLKDFGLVEGIDFLKYGGVTLLNKHSLRCPKYIEVLMWNKTMTDLSKFLPYTYFSDLVDGNTKMLEGKFKKFTIEGKQFVEITDPNLSSVMMNEKLVKSVVDNSEIPELVNEDYIVGYIKVSTRKTLCWY